MFTGIIQAVGTVVSLEESRLGVLPPDSFRSEENSLGDSIAVNGACLTLVNEAADGTLHFDVSPETFARTALGTLRTGHLVNLERPMRADGRFGGHIVQGHVDATGTFESLEFKDGFHILTVRVPEQYDRYLIDKGSVAIDGISLTVVEPSGGQFNVWIVPHTLENTGLKALHPGSSVNLEFDLIAKYVEKLVASYRS